MGAFMSSHRASAVLRTWIATPATSRWRTPGTANRASASGAPASRPSKRATPAPGWTGASSREVSVSGSRGETWTLIRNVLAASDIHWLGPLHLAQRAEGEDPGVVAITECDAKRVVADAPDSGWRHAQDRKSVA